MIELLTPDHNKRISAAQIFYHPWVQSYERKFNEMKEKKKEEDKNNFTLFSGPTKSINKSNVIPEDSIKKQEVNVKAKEDLSSKSNLNDFSIFDDNDILGKNVSSPKKNDDKQKIGSDDSKKPTTSMKELIARSSVKVKNEAKQNSMENKEKQQEESNPVNKNYRYVDYFDQSLFLDGEPVDFSKFDASIEDLTVLKTPNEDQNQSLFDDVLKQVSLNNNPKKKKKADCNTSSIQIKGKSKKSEDNPSTSMLNSSIANNSKHDFSESNIRLKNQISSSTSNDKINQSLQVKGNYLDKAVKSNTNNLSTIENSSNLLSNLNKSNYEDPKHKQKEQSGISQSKNKANQNTKIIEDNPKDYFDERYTDNLKINQSNQNYSLFEEDIIYEPQNFSKQYNKEIDINYDKQANINMNDSSREKLKFEFDEEKERSQKKAVAAKSGSSNNPIQKRASDINKRHDLE